MARRKNRSRVWDWEAPGRVLDEPDPEPNVENPVARRVLTAARRAIPLGTIRGPAFDDPEKCPMEIHDYQIWVADRLRATGLAVWLAGGPAFLPDVTDELPWPWDVFARMFAPRNYEQLTRKVVGNLEWYLDQSRPVRDPWKTASSMLLPTGILAAFIVALMYFTTGLQAASWVTLLGIGLMIFAVFYFTMLTFNRSTLQHATNAAEMYRYLAEAYSELESNEDAARDVAWRKLMQRLTPFSRHQH